MSRGRPFTPSLACISDIGPDRNEVIRRGEMAWHDHDQHDRPRWPADPASLLTMRQNSYRSWENYPLRRWQDNRPRLTRRQITTW